MKKEQHKAKGLADYYDRKNILDELLEEPVEFSLDEPLVRDIFCLSPSTFIRPCMRRPGVAGVVKRAETKSEEKVYRPTSDLLENAVSEAILDMKPGH